MCKQVGSVLGGESSNVLKLAFYPCLRSKRSIPETEFFQTGHPRSSVIEKNNQHNHKRTTTMRAATTLATLATAVFSALPASSGFEIVEDHRNLQVAGDDEEAQRALMHSVSKFILRSFWSEIICVFLFSPAQRPLGT